MTKNKLNFNNTRIFLLSSLIIIIFIGSYIYTFKEFSSESSDWANFATFISLAIAIINLIIFYLLTLEIHKYNITQNKKNIKPIISFKLINSKESYWLENIGSGIAVDVKIKRNFSEGDNKWEEGYNYFTLSPGERVYLNWSQYSIQLVAEYKDAEGYQYYSYMDGNFLRFFDEKIGQEKYPNEFSKVTKRIIGEYNNPS